MSKIIVCWPESQELMELDGFRENCSLINGERGLDTYGSAAYLVDEDWYDEHSNDPFVEDNDDIDNDEDEEYDDDCELQTVTDWELIELGFLDEDDEYEDDEDDDDEYDE